MAKIKHMLGEKVISGFKGTLDFYYYMGIACVRKWPASPGHKRSAAVEAQWIPFKQAAILAGTLDTALIQFYTDNAVSTNMTWKDLFFRSYMSGLPTEVYQGEG